MRFKSESKSKSKLSKLTLSLLISATIFTNFNSISFAQNNVEVNKNLSVSNYKKIVEIDNIIAVVGNEVITQNELNKSYNQWEQRLIQRGIELPAKDDLQKQLLERLILHKAQLQKAKELGISVNDAELNNALHRIADNNNMSFDEFKNTLENSGNNFADLQEEIRDEITINKLKDFEIDSRINISEAEIDNYLKHAKNNNQFLSNNHADNNADNNANQNNEIYNNQYLISHIIIRVPETATPEVIENYYQKALDIQQQAMQGKNFNQLAVAFSDAQDALSGGNLGWKNINELPNLYAEMVANLQENQISSVVRSPAGFHIIKINQIKAINEKSAKSAKSAKNKKNKKSKKSAKNSAKDTQQNQQNSQNSQVLQQTHVKHILIRINEGVSEQKARDTLQRVRDKILHGDDFGEQAKLYSQDASAPQGGDLGWINPGDTVPEFEKAMENLAIGEVSEIIKTPFGVHLILVQERRSKDISAEQERALARKILRDRHIEEAYQDWLRELRDATYVEIRNNNEDF